MDMGGSVGVQLRRGPGGGGGQPVSLPMAAMARVRRLTFQKCYLDYQSD
jgi:hypothetical protein